MRRRTAATVLVALITASAVAAPAFATTSTVQRTETPVWLKHYRERCKQIEASVGALPSSTTATVVLLGDSITEGHPSKQLGGLSVMNQGIGSDRIDVPTSSAGVRQRLAFVAKARPAHLFLMIGINDLGWGGETTDTIKAQYTDLVKALTQALPNTTIHLQSVLPTRGKQANLVPGVIELNSHIRHLAEKYRLDYIDLFDLVRDEKNELRKDLTYDGVHLNAEGYKIWIRVMEERLKTGGEANKQVPRVQGGPDRPESR